VFGADLHLTPFVETKSELKDNLLKNKEMELFLFPIRIAFYIDSGGPYKCYLIYRPTSSITL
jgi:hypothetical protein